MASKEKHVFGSYGNTETFPFQSAEEAWFWFIQAQQAQIDGARFTRGQSLLPRPCEPIDILKVVDRLYRKRRLLRDHLLVLRHYGRRRLAPDPGRIKEARAHTIWVEALERIERPLLRKGIVEYVRSRENWHQRAVVLEGAYS